MIPGKHIEIYYGWSNRSHDGVNNGKFKGLLYNFSYDIQDDGSFSCNADCVGEGYFISGLNLNSEISKDNKQKDEKSTETLINNIYSLIETNINKALKENHNTNYYPQYNLVNFTNNSEWQKAANNDNSGIQQNKSNWYIELVGFINIINENLLNDSNIKVNVNAISYYDRYIKSADPSIIIFPDENMGKYSDNIIFNVNSEFKRPYTYVQQNPDKELIVDLGKTLISTNFIREIIDSSNVNNDTNDILFKPFINKIFDVIKDNSGGFYNLALTTDIINDNNTTREQLNIKEINYLSMPPDNNYSNKILQFEPFTKNSIVKAQSLSSQLPDKMATALYLGDSSVINDKVKDIFLGNETAPDQQKPENEKIDYDAIDKLLAKPKTQSQPNYSQSPDSNAPNTNTFDSFETRYEDETFAKSKTFEKFKMIDNIKQAAYTLSFDQNVNNVQSLKTALYTYTSKDEDSPMTNSFLLPLNFSLTLEGINGFKFGNIISSTYLPTKYIKHKNKIVFIITKISDSIENGEWTTEIETQCNLLNL